MPGKYDLLSSDWGNKHRRVKKGVVCELSPKPTAQQEQNGHVRPFVVRFLSNYSEFMKWQVN